MVDGSGKVRGPPRIQVLDKGDEDTLNDEEIDEAILYDFQFPQCLPQQTEESTTTSDTAAMKYGFNNQYTGHFTHLQNPEILTTTNPEYKTSWERWEEMRRQEDEKFDREWYLADMFEPPEELEEILGYTVRFDEGVFAGEEQVVLQRLGRKECTILPLSSTIFLLLFLLRLPFTRFLNVPLLHLLSY